MKEPQGHGMFASCQQADRNLAKLRRRVKELEATRSDAHLLRSHEWSFCPNEAAWWWHWSGEDLAIPFIYHVQESGIAKGRYFIDFPDSRWCDEVGGYWLKVQYPNVPSRDEQKALLASRSKEPKGATATVKPVRKQPPFHIEDEGEQR